MPIADLVYNSDIANKPKKCDCGCDDSFNTNNCQPWWGAEPPCPPPPPYWDYPPYPYGYPCDKPCPPTQEPTNKQTIEQQICSLSKKSSIIKNMIEAYEKKNKDAIIKIGGISYNFGSYKTITKGPDGEEQSEDSKYGESVLKILKDEQEAIKAKIKELAEELDAEPTSFISYGLERTITQ